MAVVQIVPPYPIFADLDGSPLDNGYIYVGVENLNPETNPVVVYWDSALTIPATQPIRTIGGYASRNGTPAGIFTDGPCSLTVKDKRQNLVYYSLSARAGLGTLAFLDSVGTAQIDNLAVTSGKIADSAVTNAKIADNSVTLAKMADNSVSTAEIVDKSVSFAKMPDIATSSIIGRSTAGTGAPENLTIGGGLRISGGAMTAHGIIDRQVFTANGTWTKPAGLSANAIAVIDLIGGGSSGAARSTTGNAAGGQGGRYVSVQVPVSYLAATESVVVGAEVAGVTGNTNGNQGNLSSITINGTVLTTGRPYSPNQSAGSVSAFSEGGTAFLDPTFDGVTLATINTTNNATSPITTVPMPGMIITGPSSALGGSVSSTNVPTAGTPSAPTGGGGGCSSAAGGVRTGGKALFGGAGGAGGANTGGNGVDGTAPGGGGGAAVQGGTSGKGARGEVRVTIFD